MAGKVFGLEMSKGSKRMVYVCVPLALICIAMYLVLALFEVSPQEQVMYPAGGLTESIFDSQNLLYVAEPSFGKKNSFINIPYTIDTIDGKKASIGNAAVYEYAPYYFYYSEMKKGSSVVDVLQRELTSVLSITADPLATKITVLNQEKGYVNGCAATFYVLQITVSGEKKTTDSQYMCLYELIFDESIYETSWSMLVGSMTNDYSTSSLLALQTLSYSNVHTLRFDAEAAKKLEKQ